MTTRSGRRTVGRPVTRGRRPGGQDTRAEILAAARESFAERGFAGTTIRGVAAAAGVDSALVHHFFGTKDDLFVAALQVPVDPRVVLAAAVEQGLDGLGERLVSAFLTVWEDPEARLPVLAMVRAGIAGEPGRSLLEAALTRLVLGAIVERLDIDDKERRAGLVASQMVGLIVTRYVIGLAPLVALTPEEIVAWVGPTVQRYLSAPLP